MTIRPEDEDRDLAAGRHMDAGAVEAWLTGSGADFTGQPEPTGVPVDLLPPLDAPVSIVRGIRLPVELDEAIRTAAEARGIPMSMLIREFIVRGLAGTAANDPVVELRRDLTAALALVDRIADRAA